MKPLFDPTKIIFIKDGHEYYVEVDGTTVRPPSLSSVLRSTGLSPVYKDEVPEWVMERARQRGEEVHDQLHKILVGKPRVVGQHETFVQAAVKLITKHNIVPVMVETPLFNPVFDYCCTPDVVGTVEGHPAIVDWKTTYEIHWEAGFQLAGQALCYRDPEAFDLYIGDARTGVLRPFKDPEYLRIARNAFQTFNDVQDLREKYA